MAFLTIVDYNDLDHIPITDDQYRANLYNQIRDPSLPDGLTTIELERIVDKIARRRPEFHIQKVSYELCDEGTS